MWRAVGWMPHCHRVSVFVVFRYVFPLSFHFLQVIRHGWRKTTTTTKNISWFSSFYSMFLNGSLSPLHLGVCIIIIFYCCFHAVLLLHEIGITAESCCPAFASTSTSASSSPSSSHYRLHYNF